MEQKTHCYYCGEILTEKNVEGRSRLFCKACNRPIYENPIPATCVVVVDARHQVLLVKRNVPPKIGQWCLPGGFIELGESPDQGAIRELKEETGMTGTIEKLIGVCTTPSTQYHSVLMVGYSIVNVAGQIKPGDDASEVRWFHSANLPPIAFDSHRRFLDQYLGKYNFPM